MTDDLKKFTLSPGKKGGWDLRRDNTDRKVAGFETKADATKGGVLKQATGGDASVKIQKQNGRFQEERTFPRSKDPKNSKG
jgi:hypothetical protein